MKEKIARMAESLKPDLVKFLREIIAIPSMSGEEDAVIQRIKEEMERIGCDKVWVDPFGNLLGLLGSGTRILAVDCHCDTVGIGSPDTWEFEPFKGDYRAGTIFGRGASDQKGGLAAAVYAAKILKEIGIPTDMCFLVVASVLEEDFEGLCWQYIIKEEKLKPEAVLLTEPSNLGIRIGQRGRLEIKVKTRGTACHGSAPQRGENAIYKMAPIIQEIEQLNNRLPDQLSLGKGSVTVSEIRSTAPSLCAVADSAVIHLDRRVTEAETLQTCVQEIADLASVKASKAEVIVPEYNVRSYTGLIYPTTAYYPMWIMDRQHPLVQCARRAYGKQFSEEGDVGCWSFSTNGVATKGLFDIPSIGFGPGSEEFAHTPYDQVNESDLLKALQFYAAFALEWSSTPLTG